MSNPRDFDPTYPSLYAPRHLRLAADNSHLYRDLDKRDPVERYSFDRIMQDQIAPDPQDDGIRDHGFDGVDARDPAWHYDLEPQSPLGQPLFLQSAPAEQPRQPSDDLPQRGSRMLEDAIARALTESQAPQDIYTPSMQSRRSPGAINLIGRYGAAMTMVALLALFFVLIAPIVRSPAPDAVASADVMSIWPQAKTSVSPAPPLKAAASTLQFADQTGDLNDTLPIGVSVTAPQAGAVVVLTGVPNGSRLSAGKKMAADEWRIPAQDIAVAVITPPVDFAGQVTVNAELRNADGAAAVRGAYRMAWNRPTASMAPAAPLSVPPQVIAPVVSLSQNVAPVQAAHSPPRTRYISPAELLAMTKRAMGLIASGDMVAARLLLQRAAEGRSANAAFVLAQTYDPIALDQIRHGPLPDVDLARAWYRKAQELGAADAQRQLVALQSH